MKLIRVVFFLLLLLLSVAVAVDVVVGASRTLAMTRNFSQCFYYF